MLASGISAAALLLLLTSTKQPTMGSAPTTTPSTSASASAAAAAAAASTAAARTDPAAPPPGGAAGSKEAASFSSLDFEVFGKVQGVYFRQHVTDKADEINERATAETGAKALFGWVRNTASGSVEGVAQSASHKALAEFEHFVTKVGSPASRIDGFEVRNRREVERPEFEAFERRY